MIERCGDRQEIFIVSLGGHIKLLTRKRFSLESKKFGRNLEIELPDYLLFLPSGVPADEITPPLHQDFLDSQGRRGSPAEKPVVFTDNLLDACSISLPLHEGTLITIIVGLIALEFHPVVEDPWLPLDCEDDPLDGRKLPQSSLDLCKKLRTSTAGSGTRKFLTSVVQVDVRNSILDLYSFQQPCSADGKEGSIALGALLRCRSCKQGLERGGSSIGGRH